MKLYSISEAQEVLDNGSLIYLESFDQYYVVSETLSIDEEFEIKAGDIRLGTAVCLGPFNLLF